MRIAFVGDVHGCVYQCLAALLKLNGESPLDAVIQVGDLGAWPDVDSMYDQDPPAKWFADDNPHTLDWFYWMGKQLVRLHSLKHGDN